MSSPFLVSETPGISPIKGNLIVAAKGLKQAATQPHSHYKTRGAGDFDNSQEDHVLQEKSCRRALTGAVLFDVWMDMTLEKYQAALDPAS
jgi:hypothetical protein